MLILLLFFLALLHSARQADFNASRCTEEMVCYSAVAGKLDQFTKTDKPADIEGRAGLVAMRPYSENKWLVAMRGKGVEVERMTLEMVSPSHRPLFECKPNGNQTELKVEQPLTPGTTYSTYVNEKDHIFVCEFEVEFPSALLIYQPETIQLTIATAAKPWKNKFYGGYFKEHADPDYRKCEPDSIQFVGAESDSETHAKVDGHRLAVACREGWTLTAKWADRANYSTIDSLVCEMKEESGVKKYRYTVEYADAGTKATTSLDASQPLFARCTQKRCLGCAAVPCGKEAGCVAANFTRAAVGDACVKLECEGNRFETSVGGGEWRATEDLQPTCKDGQWSMAGAHFTAARCFKACPPLNCEGCASSNSTAATCDEGHELSISNGKSEVRVVSLACDTVTGIWAGAEGVSGTDTIACAVIGQPTGAQAVASARSKLNLIIGCVLLACSASGLLLCTCIGLRLRQRRRLAASLVSSATTTGNGNKSKRKHSTTTTSESKDGKDSSGGSGSSNNEAKTEKSALLPKAPAAEDERREEKTQPPAEPVLPPKPTTPPPPAPPPPPAAPPAPKAPAAPSKQNSQPPRSGDEDDRGYVVIDPALNNGAAQPPPPPPSAPNPPESNYLLK